MEKRKAAVSQGFSAFAASGGRMCLIVVADVGQNNIGTELAAEGALHAEPVILSYI